MSVQLDPRSVKKIAYLSRLSENPDAEFIDRYATELSKILNYVEELEEVDVSGVDPLAGSRVIYLPELRLDEPDSQTDQYQSVRQNIIHNFPNKQGNLLMVPGIFE